MAKPRGTVNNKENAALPRALSGTTRLKSGFPGRLGVSSGATRSGTKHNVRKKSKFRNGTKNKATSGDGSAALRSRLRVRTTPTQTKGKESASNVSRKNPSRLWRFEIRPTLSMGTQ